MRASIIVSAIPVRQNSPGRDLVRDRFDAVRDGATAVTLGANGIAVETVAAERGRRPWSVRGSKETAKTVSTAASDR
jgi:hypothetical protein